MLLPSPHYANTERDYEGDYQATLPQGHTAARGCKPRHGRGDRKQERGFSGLRGMFSKRVFSTTYGLSAYGLWSSGNGCAM